MRLAIASETRSCGGPVEAFVADSLNAVRHPQLKQLLLDRKLHVFRCDACEGDLMVEKEFLYIDLDGGHFIGVFPRGARHRAAECSARLSTAFRSALGENAPTFVREQARTFLVRVCFGLEEVREKLIADGRLASAMAGPPPAVEPEPRAVIKAINARSPNRSCRRAVDT